MLKYENHLKPYSQQLRKKPTKEELLLWGYIRKKQIANTRITRQKPIGPYIVDFYAPSVKLVIEIDGKQHYDSFGREQDSHRDRYLISQGLNILRFNNLEVNHNTETVVKVIEKKILGIPYFYDHGKFITLY